MTGSGKTTTAKLVVGQLKNLSTGKIELTAPTGIAAKDCREWIWRQTIHRLLG